MPIDPRDYRWGRGLAILLPYTQDLETDLEIRSRELAQAKDRIDRLERDLKESAEARVRAEDNSRFLQSRLSDTQTQLDSALTRLFTTHEKTADWLALAVTGGRRALYNGATASDPSAAVPEPLHQPITTGKMRASDLRAVATRVSEAEDRRRAEEARRMAHQLRQQAAAEAAAGEDGGDHTPEQRKAAADIAYAIEQEILGTAI
jgi:hypothetical protein